MSLPEGESATQADWEVTPEGLYVATRHFLVRRGYCCANRCRNCPYINWRDDPTWQHAPAAAIRRASVSPKALAGARAQLVQQEQAGHQETIIHYRLLLERWR